MRATLPTGLVTFLFSDIEGSTLRWERHREAMQLALRRHDRLLRAAIESHNGRVFKTMGDQFCAAFWSAAEAVAAALYAQRAIAAEDWSAIGGLHVRMAIHTGVTDEREGDYFGPAVNRVARLLAIGHGGQVLLSGFAADSVADQLPQDSSLRDLGPQRLKDLAQPERVYQVVRPESTQSYPKLRPLAAPSNLPERLTAFLGREKEVAAVTHLVETERLVTLAGSGGVGKTSTAVRVAASLAEKFDDGAWIVELAPVSDPALVPSAIAAVFDVEDRGGSRKLIESIALALRSRQTLIVLDNCEHVVFEAAAAAERILRACPNVRVLATSREALHVDGERVYHLPPLAMPPAGPIDARKARTYASVALFVERAQAATQAFALTDANATFVADIVRRLDGIALAIELAAARVPMLSVEQLDARLDERFKILTSGRRTALPRQQTLRALIDWSYDLLDPAEKSLLLQLAVFRDGWTIEAANAVCTLPGAATDVLPMLSNLVDKSLVVAGGERGALRYRLLETTRQYAVERLEDAALRDHVAMRHCRYFCELSGRLYDDFWKVSEERHVAQVREELENYRAAIEWGLAERKDVASAALIVANLGSVWRERSLSEGSRLLTQALDALGDAQPAIRGRLLNVRALLTADGALGFDAATEAAALLERGTDRVTYADALRHLGNSTGRIGRPADSVPVFERALAVARPLNLPRLTSAILDWLGFCLAYIGNYAAGRRAFDEAIALAREAGDPGRMPLTNFAELQFGEGDLPGAIASTREALAIMIEIGRTPAIMIAHANLAAYLAAAGDLRQAWGHARSALGEAMTYEQHMPAAIAMQHLAQIAARGGDPEKAARLIGYINSVYEREKHPREPTERVGYARIVAILQAAFAPARLAELEKAGASLSEAAAAALALSIEQPKSERTR